MNTRPKHTTQSQSGYQLIEVVIASGIIIILAQAFFTLITTSYRQVGLSRIQASARAIATQELETIRNLPYQDIGTQGGIPAGTIVPQKTANSNGQQFDIVTSIVYIDDPFDGLAPTDLYAGDYKRVKVSISWTSTFPTQEIMEIITDVSPKGQESQTDGGIILVQVFDANGQPVSQADVHIEAPSLNPPIDINLFTNNNGQLMIPGSPVCNSCYTITVTKVGYSTDRTYTTSEVPNPSKPPLTILQNQISQISFAIDLISNVTIESRGPAPAYSLLPNTDFHIQSTKTVGFDTLGDPVFETDQDATTDGSGSLNVQLAWGTYKITLDNIDQDLAGSNPLTPFNIYPNENKTIAFISQSHASHSLLTSVINASGSAIATASAHLYDGISFDFSISTAETNLPDFGQAFFSPLSAGTYTLEISHPDYETATRSVTIDGATQEVVILNTP